MEERIIFEEIHHGEEAEVAKTFFERFPEADAAFVSGDMLAICLYERALAAGKKVPEEFKLIAYDGVINNWLSLTKLTSIKQDLDAIADAIVDQLVKKINGKPFDERIIVPSLFVQGNTT